MGLWPGESSSSLAGPGSDRRWESDANIKWPAGNDGGSGGLLSRSCCLRLPLIVIIFLHVYQHSRLPARANYFYLNCQPGGCSNCSVASNTPLRKTNHRIQTASSGTTIQSSRTKQKVQHTIAVVKALLTTRTNCCCCCLTN